jgi:hypothetical protein
MSTLPGMNETDTTTQPPSTSFGTLKQLLQVVPFGCELDELVDGVGAPVVGEAPQFIEVVPFPPRVQRAGRQRLGHRLRPELEGPPRQDR